ncbi:hypothetical protein ACFXJ8_35020 [Nonomuraea sp. NPDC059194]|uniref:hypothetical protein n=1 Tax=Nonomuraea sp. NPDC059194 TaxID=3346764 RepID=UPI0036AEB8D3
MELPAEAFGGVTGKLIALGAELDDTSPTLVTGSLPARLVNTAKRHLPGLTGGMGVWWSRPSGDRPISSRNSPARL